jgi:hypothetical protein
MVAVGQSRSESKASSRAALDGVRRDDTASRRAGRDGPRISVRTGATRATVATGLAGGPRVRIGSDGVLGDDGDRGPRPRVCGQAGPRPRRACARRKPVPRRGPGVGRWLRIKRAVDSRSQGGAVSVGRRRVRPSARGRGSLASRARPRCMATTPTATSDEQEPAEQIDYLAIASCEMEQRPTPSERGSVGHSRLGRLLNWASSFGQARTLARGCLHTLQGRADWDPA